MKRRPKPGQAGWAAVSIRLHDRTHFNRAAAQENRAPPRELRRLLETRRAHDEVTAHHMVAAERSVDDAPLWPPDAPPTGFELGARHGVTGPFQLRCPSMPSFAALIC